MAHRRLLHQTAQEPQPRAPGLEASPSPPRLSFQASLVPRFDVSYAVGTRPSAVRALNHPGSTKTPQWAGRRAAASHTPGPAPALELSTVFGSASSLRVRPWPDSASTHTPALEARA